MVALILALSLPGVRAATNWDAATSLVVRRKFPPKSQCILIGLLPIADYGNWQRDEERASFLLHHHHTDEG
jgi:hypothetical protein